ncbi:MULTISPECIES: glycosyltransferase family A protein [Nocardiopsidaceae]|uniref:Glycosyltransferase family A protein n=1 Tax=Streptomonospora nanhaiensis TaxID=1323731 RepID=A0ABY6YKX6_9ACTN|nr:glycosyltransferase family A protein [Streptomonospora nanhaiensis]WAE72695.1 glycosyltransferase family A protein [Streptomonospora nanhaiensis]
MTGGELADALRLRGSLPTLVCHTGAAAAEAVGELALGAGDRAVDLDRVVVGEPGAGGGPADPHAGVVAVVAATATDLRRALVPLGVLPPAPFVVVVLLEVPSHQGPPVPVAPAPGEWSELLELRVRRLAGGGWSCEACFEDPVYVHRVAGALARGVVGGRPGAAPVPAVSVLGADAGLWCPGGARVADPRKADVVLRVGPAEPGGPVVPEGARGGGVRRLSVEESSWAAAGRPGGTVHGRFRVEDVPPVDERTVNPTGFVGRAGPKVGRLVSRGGRWVLVSGGSVRWRVPEDGTVTDVDVARLRDLRAVDVEWGRHSGPLAAVRAVAGLAAAGVPLVGGPVPPWARCLGADLCALVASVGADELADGLVREEHSVRLRRAALGTHGVRARWRDLGAAAGVGGPPDPAVSVVLCTRRPEMLGFALRQVARQRGVEVELVLGLHGFGEDAPGVREATAAFRRTGRALQVFRPDPDAVLGSVLNEGIARASGSAVAKMDDDDWYGPDHLADLVLARRYSGADVVGSAAEFVYLETLDLTVRRSAPTECLWRRAAGGTLLMDRTAVEEVGGFPPVGTAEDTGLFAGIELLGGRVYRGHGLNYVLRRRASGHTWDVGAGHFLRNGAERRRGWRPSALLESEAADAPAGAAPRELRGEPTVREGSRG